MGNWKMADLREYPAAIHFRSPRGKKFVARGSPRRKQSEGTFVLGARLRSAREKAVAQSYVLDFTHKSRLLSPERQSPKSTSKRGTGLHLSSDKLRQFESAVQVHLSSPKVRLRTGYRSFTSKQMMNPRVQEIKEEWTLLERDKCRVLRRDSKPRFVSVSRIKPSIVREWRAEIAEHDYSLLNLTVV